MKFNVNHETPGLQISVLYLTKVILHYVNIIFYRYISTILYKINKYLYLVRANIIRVATAPNLIARPDLISNPIVRITQR